VGTISFYPGQLAIPVHPHVLDLLIDEINEEKFVAHGMTSRQVAQILENEYIVVPNRRGRRGLLLLIGRDHGGACIAAPLEPTPIDTTWRPITAWPRKPHELDRLQQATD
jgi:hypothetical protein